MITIAGTVSRRALLQGSAAAAATLAPAPYRAQPQRHRVLRFRLSRDIQVLDPAFVGGLDDGHVLSGIDTSSFGHSRLLSKAGFRDVRITREVRQARFVSSMISRSRSSRAVGAGKVYRDDWQKLGISPLNVTQDAIVQGGKIKFFNTTFTPESGSRLQAARK